MTLGTIPPTTSPSARNNWLSKFRREVWMPAVKRGAHPIKFAMSHGVIRKTAEAWSQRYSGCVRSHRRKEPVIEVQESREELMTRAFAMPVGFTGGLFGFAARSPINVRDLPGAWCGDDIETEAQ
jgi:hypothetical protein